MNDLNEKRLELPEKGSDSLLPFQLEKSIVRGRFVRLNQTLDHIFDAHDYPEPVCMMLAEATSMAAALGSALKFDGIFTLQTQTNGPVSRLVVDVTSDGAIRACATYDEARIQADSDLLGTGHLVFTVDQKISDERYQGVVELDGKGLTEAFQAYFKQSEQIPTGILSVADKDKAGNWHSACLMVQRMPRDGGEEVDAPKDDTAVEDDWFRVMSLMQTATSEELLDQELAYEDLLFRLFHEEGVRVYDCKAFRDECRCSRAKIEGVINSMSADDLKDVTDENGEIVVTCQFCSKAYVFDPADVTAK